MRNAALAMNDEYDEVPVSSTEVLEANVAAIRDGLNDFKAEIRAALTGINGEIKSLRERGDKHFERLSSRIDSTNHELAELSNRVVLTDSKLKAVGWIWGGFGGVGTLIGLITIVGKVLHRF